MVLAVTPFEFKQCIGILKSTGKKARNVKELSNFIGSVSDECIFHHTYQYFLKEHVLEYTNDFAQWVGESLEERSLAEQLSNIDPYRFETIRDVRQEFQHVITGYMEGSPEPREARRGDEFYFNETVTLVFPVGIWVRNLAEFLMAMKVIERGSIYYHFYEARVRVKERVDDFSKWISDVLGENDLAMHIQSIDPFMHNVEEIRHYIGDAVEEWVRKDMERMVRSK
ncbi:MAG: DUF5752 family protein [Lentimicrobium sp.]|nr:DUF5752 family protein [Lentimicrobium sp.]